MRYGLAALERVEDFGQFVAAIDTWFRPVNFVNAPDGTLHRRLSVPHHMRIVRSMWDDPPWTDFPLITAPVLLLPAVPAGASASDPKSALVVKAAGALARARIREYVGADHDLHAQHPDEVAADLLALAKEA